MSYQRNHCRALLIIDQEPIRNAASKEMQTLYGKMQNLRGKIEDFETKDRPAFTRWLRTEFNEQLSDLATLQDKLGDAEDLANEIQMVRFALGCSYYDAYVNAMERRRAGISFEERFGSDFGEDDSSDESEEDSEPSSKQRSKKNKSEKENSKSGDSFEMHGHEDDASEPSADEGEGESFWSKVKRTAKSAGDSLKARYRELARLLHPDLRGGGDAWTKELWERTQAAYNDGNDQELEHLLVLAKVSSGDTSSGDSSVWDLKKGITFLKSALKDLRSEVSLMSQDMAWGFISLKDHTRLRRKISYDLEYQHDEALVRLENLEAQLARWSVPPARKAKTRPSQPRSNWDLEIDF